MSASDSSSDEDDFVDAPASPAFTDLIKRANRAFVIASSQALKNVRANAPKNGPGQTTVEGCAQSTTAADGGLVSFFNATPIATNYAYDTFGNANQNVRKSLISYNSPQAAPDIVLVGNNTVNTFKDMQRILPAIKSKVSENFAGVINQTFTSYAEKLQNVTSTGTDQAPLTAISTTALLEPANTLIDKANITTAVGFPRASQSNVPWTEACGYVVAALGMVSAATNHLELDAEEEKKTVVKLSKKLKVLANKSDVAKARAAERKVLKQWQSTVNHAAGMSNLTPADIPNTCLGEPPAKGLWGFATAACVGVVTMVKHNDLYCGEKLESYLEDLKTADREQREQFKNHVKQIFVYFNRTGNSAEARLKAFTDDLERIEDGAADNDKLKKTIESLAAFCRIGSQRNNSVDGGTPAMVDVLLTTMTTDDGHVTLKDFLRTYKDDISASRPASLAAGVQHISVLEPELTLKKAVMTAVILLHEAETTRIYGTRTLYLGLALCRKEPNFVDLGGVVTSLNGLCSAPAWEKFAVDYQVVLEDYGRTSGCGYNHAPNHTLVRALVFVWLLSPANTPDHSRVFDVVAEGGSLSVRQAGVAGSPDDKNNVLLKKSLQNRFLTPSNPLEEAFDFYVGRSTTWEAPPRPHPEPRAESGPEPDAEPDADPGDATTERAAGSYSVATSVVKHAPPPPKTAVRARRVPRHVRRPTKNSGYLARAKALEEERQRKERAKLRSYCEHEAQAGTAGMPAFTFDISKGDLEGLLASLGNLDTIKTTDAVAALTPVASHLPKDVVEAATSALDRTGLTGGDDTLFNTMRSMQAATIEIAANHGDWSTFVPCGEQESMPPLVKLPDLPLIVREMLVPLCSRLAEQMGTKDSIDATMWSSSGMLGRIVTECFGEAGAEYFAAGTDFLHTYAVGAYSMIAAYQKLTHALEKQDFAFVRFGFEAIGRVASRQLTGTTMVLWLDDFVSAVDVAGMETTKDGSNTTMADRMGASNTHSRFAAACSEFLAWAVDGDVINTNRVCNARVFCVTTGEHYRLTYEVFASFRHCIAVLRAAGREEPPLVESEEHRKIFATFAETTQDIKPWNA